MISDSIIHYNRETQTLYPFFVLNFELGPCLFTFHFFQGNRINTHVTILLVSFEMHV